MSDCDALINNGLPASAPTVPDHQLLRSIGRGSFGEVWLARNMMGTYRAVKVVYQKAFESQRHFDRELAGVRHFEPVSRSHEGFVDVLHAGMNEEQGFFYCIMELGDDMVHGQNIEPENYCPRTLSRVIAAQGRISPEETLRLGLALSLALAELHKHGLVHRDVKPSNIIFVNGVPKLADIGLVTGFQPAPSFVGTEGFIPPEGPGSPQADVYGLGKVLYEACTGLDRLNFPELPKSLDTSSRQHHIFLELNEVILEACQGTADCRFESAWDMHARLLVIANGRSVRRLRALERRWARMKQGAVITSVVLLALAGYCLYAYRQYQNTRELHQRQVASNLGFGNRALEAGDLLGSLPYFAEALRLDQGKRGSERDHRLRFGSAHAQSPKLVQMWCMSGPVSSVGLSLDGDQVLVIERHGKAQVLSAISGNPISPRFGQDGALWRGGLSADGRFAVTPSEDKSACVWRVSDGYKMLNLDHPDKVLSANFNPDGTRLVTGGLDKVARVWDLRTQKSIFELRGHTGNIRYAAFSPDGRSIVTTSEDGSARLWDAVDGRLLLPPLEHRSWVMYAAFSPDGKTMVTACSDHKARVWDVATGQHILPDMSHQDGVSTAEFSPDGRHIVTAGLDRMVRFWQAESHQPAKCNPILRHSDRVMQAVFSRDGHRLVSLTPQANGGQSEVQVWETQTGKPASPPLLIANEITNLVLSPDGGRLLAYGGRIVRTWDLASGRVLVNGFTHSAKVQAAVWSPAADLIASWSGPIVSVWSAATGQELFPPLNHPVPVTHVEFSPDGSRLLTCMADPGFTKCLARMWDVRTGRGMGQPMAHDDGVLCSHFSPDGKRVATASEDFSAIVWDTETGTRLTPALLHEGQVFEASFSQDGQWLATASADRTARIWSAATGEPLSPWLLHPWMPCKARFLSDPGCLVTSDQYGNSWLWKIPLEQRPAQDLVLLAQLLSGDTITPWGQPNAPRQHSLEDLWRKLRDRYPADFATTAEDVSAWHEFQAIESEMEGNWSAAAFHLEHGLALHPGDPYLSKSLARIKTHLPTSQLQPATAEAHLGK